MALKGFKAFSDAEVVFVKENLLRGVTVSDLARHFGVSGETISKIKRGLTYTHVWVAGEEKLRPQSPLGERHAPLGPVLQAPRAQTEEEFEAKLGESVRELARAGVLPTGETLPDWARDIPDTPMD